MTKAREIQISLEPSQILSIDHMLKDITAKSLTYTQCGVKRVFHVLVGECLIGQTCCLMMV